METTGIGNSSLAGFRHTLIAWGRENFRPFPWRFTENPYHILIAEVMLHRTQAKQIVPIYQRFIKRYPGIADVARSDRDELRLELYSLGLHWRIDLIRDMAAEITARFGGEVPQAREELLGLPGVSQYIASAVRCFAWNSPDALIDTNTVRVAGRLFGLETKDSSRRSKKFAHLLEGLVDPDSPRDYGFAILDLASKVCTARVAPDCVACPLTRWCAYGTRSTADARKE